MATPKGSSAFNRIHFGQARHIIDKFGGEAALATLIGVHRTAVYRWNYEPPRGTNGLIPHHQRIKIVQAARLEGVLLTEDDWLLRRIKPADLTVEDLLK